MRLPLLTHAPRAAVPSCIQYEPGTWNQVTAPKSPVTPASASTSAHKPAKVECGSEGTAFSGSVGPNGLSQPASSRTSKAMSERMGSPGEGSDTRRTTEPAGVEAKATLTVAGRPQPWQARTLLLLQQRVREAQADLS